MTLVDWWTLRPQGMHAALLPMCYNSRYSSQRCAQQVTA